MATTRTWIRQDFFQDRPLELVTSGEFCATAFRYETGIPALKVENSRSSMVILPYFGMQVWFVEFDGRELTQKSMFEEPQDTTKFGDNYGGFLYHCGLNNVNGPADGEDPYPMHDVLPFGAFRDVYVETGTDDEGDYLAVGGTYIFRNSQELHWAYTPEMRLHEDSTMVDMTATIENRRTHPLEYVWLCHMNWLGVDGARFVDSCPRDPEHFMVIPTELGGDSSRAVAIREWSQAFLADPTAGDVLDSDSQVYDPELCVNCRYEADADGWAHAMQVMPAGDACYVGWDTAKAPWALRWFCRTGDEDGVGIALPSTGTCQSTTYQKEHGYFNTLEPGGTDIIRWCFGYLTPDEAKGMTNRIEAILEG